MPASQGTYLASQSVSVGTAWEGDTQSLPSLQPPVKERKEQRKKKEETPVTQRRIFTKSALCRYDHFTSIRFYKIRNQDRRQV